MHYSNVTTRRPTVAEPLDGRQVRNTDGGGFVYQVSDQSRLERFLILGTDKPTYYTSAQDLTKQNFDFLKALIAKDGVNVVKTIVTISHEGRAPKQDAGIFALAMCAGIGNDDTRRAAFNSLPAVCRTASTLMQFVNYVGQFRGWGRGLRTAVAKWFESMPVSRLAYQVAKYKSRYDWTHRDLMRKSHPRVGPIPVSLNVRSEDAEANAARATLFDYVCERADIDRLRKHEALGVIVTMIEAQNMETNLSKGLDVDLSGRLDLVSHLTHEMVPTAWKKDPKVWEALLGNMPMTAMIRNLASMTACGLLTPLSDATKTVVERLRDRERLAKARIHPINLLIALGVYRTGRGDKGSLTWIPAPAIVDALDAAFYLAFPNIVPAGKRTRIGLDVSGSMNTVAFSNLTAREITTAMSLMQVNTEPVCDVYGFSRNLTRVPVAPGQRIADVMNFTNGLPFESTNIGLPIHRALENREEVDTFVIYTDNEVNMGYHPSQLLRQYREQMGINAKLVVCGVTATGFTVADPSDAGMLDVVGFDAAVPRLIADFSRGSSTLVEADEDVANGAE